MSTGSLGGVATAGGVLTPGGRCGENAVDDERGAPLPRELVLGLVAKASVYDALRLPAADVETGGRPAPDGPRPLAAAAVCVDD
jgi:hypothetical protein